MEQLKSGYTAELEVLEREGSRWVLDGDEDHIMMNVSDADETIQEGIWYKSSCIRTDAVN